MSLNGIDYLFWAAGFLAEVLLLVVLIARHRVRSFPFFTAMISESIVTTVILYFLSRYGTKGAYAVGYFWTGFVDLTLQVLVFFELASHVFKPVGKWAPDIRDTFVGLICGSSVIAVSVTLLTTPPAKTWLQGLIIRGNFLSSVLMVELFVGMVVLSSTARLPWKTHVARIAQGMGAYSLVGIVTEAGHSLFGLDHSAAVATAFSYAGMSSFVFCLGYWIVMLWRDAPAPQPLPEKMRLQLAGLHRRIEWDLDKIRDWKKS